MRNQNKRGFTLLELLLTLALAVMLMSLVGTALSFYATKLDARNSDVKRLQLAQAILNLINDDLRVAIYPPEFDDSSLSDFLSSVGGGGGAVPGEGQDLSAAGLDDLSGAEDVSGPDEGSASMSTETAETADLSSGMMATSRPGLLGNQNQIQFDMSRLPRLEEYQQQLVGDTIGEVIDLPSDIKTVSYFIQPAGGGVVDPLELAGENSSLSLVNSGGAGGGGLVRRSLDRSVTIFAMERGGMSTLSSTGDLLATEVAGLQFRYWDGLQWMMFWDSDEMGSLPLAIEVTLTMLEPVEDDGLGNVNQTTRDFIQIIRLPMGRPVESSSSSGLSSVGL